MKDQVKAVVLFAGLGLSTLVQAHNFSVVAWSDEFGATTNSVRTNNLGVNLSNREIRTGVNQAGETVQHRLESSSRFVSVDNSPELKAYTGVSNGGNWNDNSLTPNGFSTSESLAVQEYTHIGTTTESFTVDLRLHGSLTLESDMPGGGLISSNVAIVDGFFNSAMDFTNELFPVLEDNLNERSLFFIEDLRFPQDPNVNSPLLDDTNRELSIFRNTSGLGVGPHTFSDLLAEDTLTFTLEPGQNFYLLASLSAQLSGPGIADAENTLTMQFFDSNGNPATNLVAANTAVPIPAAAWLFGSALAGILGLRRRAKRVIA